MSIINNFTAYVKQIWENRPSTKSPVSAERLGYMEDGIKMNSDAMEKVAAAVLSTIVNDPDKIASMAALYAVNQTVTANAAAIAELNSNMSNRIGNTFTILPTTTGERTKVIIEMVNGAYGMILGRNANNDAICILFTVSKYVNLGNAGTCTISDRILTCTLDIYANISIMYYNECVTNIRTE